LGLRARWVIHTVGPQWSGGDKGEEEALRSCYRRCLEVADELGAASVAFPALSTGPYGYPPRQAASIAVTTLLGTPTRVTLTRLVAFDLQTFELYEEALRAQRDGG
jgi:O-acetyl-ADP-ribose deacetylase (regulator of RNase III)